MALNGVFAPAITPFDADMAPDPCRYVAHCRWILAGGAGLAPFGTNSEATSLSMDERMRLLDALIEAGLPPARMMPGTGTTNVPETVALSRHAVRHGAAGVLMLPPFYYKGVSEDGLFDHYARVIEGVGEGSLRVYLYHIPPVAQVPLGIGLIERLLGAYPGIVAGIKDSGGDWDHTRDLIERFAGPDFAVFPGSESFLLRAMRAGGAGCISATANVNPGPIAALAQDWESGGAEERQAALDRVRDAFAAHPMIAALKAAVAHHSGDPGWANVRPPLRPLGAPEAEALVRALDAAGFAMPGLAAT